MVSRSGPTVRRGFLRSRSQATVSSACWWECTQVVIWTRPCACMRARKAFWREAGVDMLEMAPLDVEAADSFAALFDIGDQVFELLAGLCAHTNIFYGGAAVAYVCRCQFEVSGDVVEVALCEGVVLRYQGHGRNPELMRFTPAVTCNRGEGGGQAVNEAGQPGGCGAPLPSPSFSRPLSGGSWREDCSEVIRLDQ